MTNLLKSITDTTNVLINSFVAFILTFIVISLIAIVVNVILNPGVISFGLI